MKPTAKKDFKLNNTFYSVGDEIDVKNKEELYKLNELGFINTMSVKEIESYFNNKIKDKTFMFKNEKKEENKEWD